MNADQLRLFINGAFASEASAQKIMKALSPSLSRMLRGVREQIELLPDDSLRRQMDWKDIQKVLDASVEPYAQELNRLLKEELPVSGAKATEETIENLKSVGVPITAGEAEALSPMNVMADSTRDFFESTKIGNQNLTKIFSTASGASPFTKSTLNTINQIVTGGIIEGLSTAEIARKIAPDLTGSRNQKLTSEAAHRLTGQAQTVARTAIQDYNRQAKEAVWNANADALKRLGLKYEFVAALDSRTCPTCAPLDGEEKDSRDDFPKTPVHPNCRCQVILIDPDDKGKVRYGQQALTKKELADVKGGEGVYKTQKKVKGEMMGRQNIEIGTKGPKNNPQSPRYADFLNKSNQTTQEMFFGGGNAGAVRAERFRQMIKRGKSPQKALEELTKVKEGTRSFVKAKPLETVTQKPAVRKKAVTPKPVEGFTNKPKTDYKAAVKEGEEIIGTQLKETDKVVGKYRKITDEIDDLKRQRFQISRSDIQLDLIGNKEYKKLEGRARIDYVSNIINKKRAAIGDKIKGLEGQIASIEKTSLGEMKNLRSQLLKTDLSNAEIKKTVDAIKMTGSNAANRAVVREQVEEFARIFNGGGLLAKGKEHITEIKLIKGRASNGKGRMTTNIDDSYKKRKGSAKATTFHEITHSLEHQRPELLQQAVAFRDSRVTSQRTVKISTLKGGFGQQQQVLPDEFHHPYTGRPYRTVVGKDGRRNVYEDRSTEILTMGTQMFATPEMMLEFYAKDPEHFKMILSLTRLTF